MGIIADTLRDISRESRLNQAEKKSLKVIAKKYEQLREYVWHKPECVFFDRPALAKKEDCTCGYFEVLKGE